MSKILLLFQILFWLSTATSIPDILQPIKEHTSYNHGLSYVFGFGVIMLVTLIRHTIIVYELPVPAAFACTSFGIIWGVGALYSPWMQNMCAISPSLVYAFRYIYVPVLIFKIAFTTDVYAFVKALPQILIISLPVAYLASIICAFMLKLMIGESWEVIDALVFGSLILPVYPIEIVRFLKESTDHTKHVSVLLQGETLLTMSWAITYHRLLMGYLSGYIVYWYQWVMGFVRIVCFGVPLGYLAGIFGSFMIQNAYDDTVGIMILSCALCYSTFYTLHWMTNSGTISTLILGAVMGMERSSLSQETNRNVKSFWETLTCIINGVFYVTIGTVIPHTLNGDISLKSYMLISVTYLMCNIARLISFFVFTPILSRLGYGLTFQTMIMCVWGGMKNPLCVALAFSLEPGLFTRYQTQIFYLHSASLFLLTQLFNATSFRLLIHALGLFEISPTRQANMTNCMRYIYEARARTVAILKMDRFLADANWPLVMRHTTLKHPYPKQEFQEDEDHEAYLFSTKFTFCPDCERNILNEPTPKEIKEMTTETKIRLLKLKKVAYWRNYENGMLSKAGIRILNQSVEVALDSPDLIIELDGLFKLFNREGWFYRFLKNRLAYFVKEGKIPRPPRQLYRLWCYRIVFRDWFFFVMNAVLVIHLCGVLNHLLNHGSVTFCFVLSLFISLSAGIMYFIEFVFKIFAYSWIYICKHGCRTYFSSCWNVLEFSICILTILHSTLHLSSIYAEILKETHIPDIVIIVLIFIRLLKLITVLRYCVFCRSLTPALIKSLNSKVDRHRALAYELSKNYIAAEEEILENLNQIVDNEQIKEVVKEAIERERLLITRTLGIAQKESPSVAATVKTKLAMCTVLTSMKEDVNDLKVAGWVDDIEYNKLLKSLAERGKFINSIKNIEPPASKLIFREVPYMGNSFEDIHFLYTNLTAKKFNEGDIVFNTGEVADSIYVVISGMLLVSYIPEAISVQKYQNHGVLPIVDYVCSMTYDEPLSDFIVPGNTLGELSILTKRPYNGTVTAETTSLVYVLSTYFLNQVLQRNPDPVDGLECRMWKFISFKKALTVMLNTPSYRSYSQEQIKYTLERAFVPNLSNYKIFVINDMIADIILIEGMAVDFNSREIYTGTCYIPRAVQKLVLPKSSYITLKCPIETKLLIIPTKEYSAYEIMITEEQTGELVSQDSDKCLRHLVKDVDLLLSSKSSRAHRQLRGVVSGMVRRSVVESPRTKLSQISSKASKASRLSKVAPSHIR